MPTFHLCVSTAIQTGFIIQLYSIFNISSQVEPDSCSAENDPNACTKCDASLHLELNVNVCQCVVGRQINL